MKSKLRIACAALLAATALPAMALQLGEIQVKSALNQPLVAAIPLHPGSLTELDGLTVGLASSSDFQRAGLSLTPTDQALRFHVVTDNNGQKLILVTSSQPVTDPYLDFLVQVNTRQGKQVHEFVVLLNPVIASPAPEVQAAPVASTPAPPPLPPAPASTTTQAAELPAPSQFPQPQRHASPAPSGSTTSGNEIPVQRGDTLYGIARQASAGTGASIGQMMLALQAANPTAFFKDNINDLRAGAILRIPGRDQIDQRSAAAAAAEVHRQYEAWRAAKPHPATVVEGSAVQAAANAAPKPGNAPSASDHLTLAPPTGEASGANNRPGVAGGTGTATVVGLRQQLQANRDTLVSLNQSNADLESRVHSLEDISAKSAKLLSLKDATIAELQHKLAAVQAGAGGAGSGNPQAAKPVPKPASASAATAKPPVHAATPWYLRPLAWVVAGLVVLALILLALSGRRRRGSPRDVPRGPLADPDDVSPQAEDMGTPEAEPAFADPAAMEPEATMPESRHDTAVRDDEDPYGLAALHEPRAAVEPSMPLPPVEPEPAVAAPEPSARSADAGAAYSDDPVDTKLDLARAYLDMGDPVGARAMLDEVLEEGTQAQKDEAKRLLAEASD